ncbi:hypothetical protein ACO2Q3_14860 [Caulobacter sp. KR2-114]|uniref:hypothetical protein n=1 Tax=Caulobacter sp. KR2-114 TaxID=3400912 RepID=UPI003BFAC507
MLKIVIGLGALAACSLPLAAAAQSYHQDNPQDDGAAAWRDYNFRPNTGEEAYGNGADDSRSYSDDARGYGDDDQGPPSAGAYGADSAYQGPDYAPPPAVDGQFTGRTGASWRDDNGRRCQWREVVRQDGDGYDSYKWVTVCR